MHESGGIALFTMSGGEPHIGSNLAMMFRVLAGSTRIDDAPRELHRVVDLNGSGWL
jgi:hypothetical protein